MLCGNSALRRGSLGLRNVLHLTISSILFTMSAAAPPSAHNPSQSCNRGVKYLGSYWFSSKHYEIWLQRLAQAPSVQGVSLTGTPWSGVCDYACASVETEQERGQGEPSAGAGAGAAISRAQPRPNGARAPRKVRSQHTGA